MKENLKLYVYKLRKDYWKFDLVLFVERAGELRGVARLSILDVEPKRKRVLNGRNIVA